MNEAPLRYALAILVGCLSAVLVYWLGAVAALLVLRGIPLGSAGGPPTNTELAAHLVLSALAGFVAVVAAGRLSRANTRQLAGPLVVLLALGAVVSFAKPASNWPAWFGVAMAIGCAVGVMGATRWRARRG